MSWTIYAVGKPVSLKQKVDEHPTISEEIKNAIKQALGLYPLDKNFLLDSNGHIDPYTGGFCVINIRPCEVALEQVELAESAELLVEDGIPKSKSFEALRDQVQVALETQLRIEAKDPELYCWIVNMYIDQVVYCVSAEYFKRKYTVNSKDDVKFGDPTEVEQSWSKVTESSRAKIFEISQITEAYDATSGLATLTVIKPGFNIGKGRVYPASTLKRDHKVFEGAKMFVDHQTESESRARPEGSVRDWVGTIKKVWSESDGTIKATAAIVDPGFKTKLDKLAEQGMLKDMGVSIRAIGEASRQKIEETETTYIESLLRCRSVDFVTFPGAGGQVEAIESSTDENDVDLITEAQLRERRSDLIEIIESKVEKANMKTLEQQLQESQATATAEKARADAATAKLQETETASKKTAAAAALTKMLSEAKLPEKAQERLKKQFVDAIEEKGMKEAIDAEAEYIKSFAPAGKVRNAGEKENLEENGTSGEKKIDLTESFQKLGLSKEEAAIAAKV